ADRVRVPSIGTDQRSGDSEANAPSHSGSCSRPRALDARAWREGGAVPKVLRGVVGVSGQMVRRAALLPRLWRKPEAGEDPTGGARKRSVTESRRKAVGTDRAAMTAFLGISSFPPCWNDLSRVTIRGEGVNEHPAG